MYMHKVQLEIKCDIFTIVASVCTCKSSYKTPIFGIKSYKPPIFLLL